MKLSLHTQPEVPLEAEVISPDGLAGMTGSQISGLTLFHGNQKVDLGDFFDVVDNGKSDLEVQGDLSSVKHIGANMTSGRLVISGDVGAHLGAGMTGGEILVEGNAGDWVGCELSGGRIVITGNAGHMIGSAVRGSATGIQGGEILVHGRVGNECGSGMRRGLIAIGGDTGDFTGVNMHAGTIVVFGQLGQRTGAGMVRGTVVSMHEAEMLPTFAYACSYKPGFLRHYLLYLRCSGMSVADEYIEGTYSRWSGDAVELNKGEVLLYRN